MSLLRKNRQGIGRLLNQTHLPPPVCDLHDWHGTICPGRRCCTELVRASPFAEAGLRSEIPCGRNRYFDVHHWHSHPRRSDSAAANRLCMHLSSITKRRWRVPRMTKERFSQRVLYRASICWRSRADPRAILTTILSGNIALHSPFSRPNPAIDRSVMQAEFPPQTEAGTADGAPT
jgi:hypothetical protein